MYEGVATLISESVTGYDEYGNEVRTPAEKTVFVKPRSVYANEFYSAAQIGLSPSIVLVISNRADYEGQKIVRYEGDLYDVVRTDWANNGDSVSLTLAERIGTHD